MNVLELAKIMVFPLMIVNIALSILSFIILRNFPRIIQGIFADPLVKKATSIMGKMSGDARASKAAYNKVNENIGKLSPALGFMAEQLDVPPMELLKMGKDLQSLPFVGPMIEKAINGSIEKFSGMITPGEGNQLNKSQGNTRSRLKPA